MQSLTRRQYLLGVSALAGGVGVMTVTAQDTRAEVAMDTLDVSGDDAALNQPPSSVQLDVSGSWTIDGQTPEQSRVVLQVEFNGTSRDMDEHVDMDTPASGDYQLGAELLDHPEITGADLLPDAVGETLESDVIVRVILLAVSNGSIQDETFIEDIVPIRLTNDGLELAVSGEGAVDVTA